MAELLFWGFMLFQLGVLGLITWAIVSLIGEIPIGKLDQAFSDRIQKELKKYHEDK